MRYACQSCPHLGTTCHGEQDVDLADRCDNTDPALCATCETPCCRFPVFRDRAIKQAGGLYLESWPAAALKLPPFLPVLKRRSHGAQNPAWAITGDAILGKRGWAKGSDLRARFEVADDALLGLDWFTHDEHLFRLLDYEPEQLADEVERFGFDFMIAPNFSTYIDTPPLFNALGLRHRTRYAAAVAARGIPVIPDASCHYPLHSYRMISRLRGHKLASFNLQTMRLPEHSEGFQSRMRELSWLLKMGGWDLLCVGAWARIPAILRRWPGAVLRTAKLYQMCEFRKDLQGRQVYASTAEALRENLAALQRLRESILSETQQQLTMFEASAALPSAQFTPAGRQ